MRHREIITSRKDRMRCILPMNAVMNGHMSYVWRARPGSYAHPSGVERCGAERRQDERQVEEKHVGMWKLEAVNP